MSHRKIVITGGPSTGKTSVIDSLTELGYVCFPEISRQVTLEARKLGIEQLFLEDPILFSEKLLEGRIKQYIEAEKHSNHLVFLDRGIPDVIAYMDYIGDSYPAHFSKACQQNSYDTVFYFPLGRLFTPRIVSAMKVLSKPLPFMTISKTPIDDLDIT